jgi:hypothetical protein
VARAVEKPLELGIFDFIASSLCEEAAAAGTGEEHVAVCLQLVAEAQLKRC